MEYQFFDFDGMSEADHKMAWSVLNSTRVELPWTPIESQKDQETVTGDNLQCPSTSTDYPDAISDSVSQLQNLEISNSMASGVAYPPSPIPHQVYQVRPNIIIPSIYMDKVHNYPGVAVPSMPIMPFIPVSCGNIREIPTYSEPGSDASNAMKVPEKFRKGRKNRKSDFQSNEHLMTYDKSNHVADPHHVTTNIQASYLHPYHSPSHNMVSSPNQTLYFAHAAAGAPIYMMGNHSSHFPVVTAPVYGSNMVDHDYTHMHPGSVPYRSVDISIQDCSNSSGIHPGSIIGYHKGSDNNSEILSNVTTTQEIDGDANVSTVECSVENVDSQAVVNIEDSGDAQVTADATPLCASDMKNEKTWASLFHSDTSNSKPVAHVSPVPVPITDEVIKNSDVIKKDPRIQMLAGKLRTYKLNDTAVAFKPRGLINKSNWCYVNSVLQALLGCPAFFNLMRAFSPVPEFTLDKSKSPILDSLVEFVHEFSILKGSKLDGAELSEDPSLEAVYIFRMLGKIQSDTFQVEGRQEDAEEFLTCLLNGLHEEMTNILKAENGMSVTANGCGGSSSGELSDDEGWYQAATHKKKGSLTRTTRMTFSPVSAIFRGQTRSVLTSGGQPRHILQPFFSLQLDIQADKVTSVQQALESLISKESVQGFTDPDTGDEVEAFRQLQLEHLPPVLILHLKRFVYNKNGGCQKVMKKVDFEATLEINRELLSQLGRNEFNSKKLRQYVLFAVVYHDGKEAGKGHYIADVYHAGLKSWLRYDDKDVKVVQSSSVLKYSPPRVPYILLYRRDVPHPI